MKRIIQCSIILYSPEWSHNIIAHKTNISRIAAMHDIFGVTKSDDVHLIS